MKNFDIHLLERDEWVIECESPFEIRHSDGSFASGRAADMVLACLREDAHDRLENDPEDDRLCWQGRDGLEYELILRGTTLEFGKCGFVHGRVEFTRECEVCLAFFEKMRKLITDGRSDEVGKCIMEEIGEVPESGLSERFAKPSSG